MIAEKRWREKEREREREIGDRQTDRQTGEHGEGCSDPFFINTKGIPSRLFSE